MSPFSSQALTLSTEDIKRGVTCGLETMGVLSRLLGEGLFSFCDRCVHIAKISNCTIAFIQLLQCHVLLCACKDYAINNTLHVNVAAPTCICM